MELNVLVIDDAVDQGIVTSLESLGANVSTCLSEEALDRIKASGFNLILLDSKFSNELDLKNQIQAITPAPIILITGDLDFISQNKITPEFLTLFILNDLAVRKLEILELTAAMENNRRKETDTLSEIIRLAKEKINEFDAGNI